MKDHSIPSIVSTQRHPCHAAHRFITLGKGFNKYNFFTPKSIYVYCLKYRASIGKKLARVRKKRTPSEGSVSRLESDSKKTVPQTSYC
ncbi:hypothetical protein AB1E18_008939 [Capra hircus]